MTRRWYPLLAAVLAFHAAAPRAMASEPTPEAVVADVLIARPAGAVVVAAGAVALLVALPFAAIARSVPETAETLVGRPARVMFCRPLGDFRKMQESSVGHKSPH